MATLNDRKEKKRTLTRNCRKQTKRLNRETKKKRIIRKRKHIALSFVCLITRFYRLFFPKCVCDMHNADGTFKNNLFVLFNIDCEIDRMSGNEWLDEWCVYVFVCILKNV